VGSLLQETEIKNLYSTHKDIECLQKFNWVKNMPFVAGTRSSKIKGKTGHSNADFLNSAPANSSPKANCLHQCLGLYPTPFLARATVRKNRKCGTLPPPLGLKSADWNPMDSEQSTKPIL
jgi:hypothetical protein